MAHLSDVVLRRTTLAIESNLTAQDQDVADTVAAALNWSEDRRAQEVETLRTVLVTRHHMTL
ncbi:MAG: glycerol-3-phosphate dehydrogenase [Sulfitobacter sp.]